MKSPPTSMLPPGPAVLRLRTAGLLDPLEPSPGPADLLLEVGPAAGRRLGIPERAGALSVLASGRPSEIDAHEAAAGALEIDLRHHVLLPGLVNAHTHLDLSHIGPLDHEPRAGFVAWVDRIRERRHADDASIAAAVRTGLDLAAAGGTILVGDIAGAPAGRPTLAPFRELAASPIGGVSFIEFFAIGTRERASIDAIERFCSDLPDRSDGSMARLGLQPHAPNTVSIDAYLHAVRLATEAGLPLATHLAESPEECAFVARGEGPQRELLERLGVWEPRILESVGRGRSPIEHLVPALTTGRFIVAHLNDAGPEPEAAMEWLAQTGTSVAYCPRASSYFGAPDHFGPHRYGEMLRAGVNVCLGTDSLVNLPADAADSARGGISVFDEARLLFTRDHASPSDLLAMATVNGARALGFDPSGFRLTPGSHPLAITLLRVEGCDPDQPPSVRALSSGSRIRFLCKGNNPLKPEQMSCFAWRPHES